MSSIWFSLQSCDFFYLIQSESCDVFYLIQSKSCDVFYLIQSESCDVFYLVQSTVMWCLLFGSVRVMWFLLFGSVCSHVMSSIWFSLQSYDFVYLVQSESCDVFYLVQSESGDIFYLVQSIVMWCLLFDFIWMDKNNYIEVNRLKCYSRLWRARGSENAQNFLRRFQPCRGLVRFHPSAFKTFLRSWSVLAQLFFSIL